MSFKQFVKFVMVVIVATCITGLLMQIAGANPSVSVVAESEGGYFEFTGDGGYWDWDLDVTGFDEAYTDLTNHWAYSTSTVKYVDVGDGEIHLKVTDRSHNSQWCYYDWGTIAYEGNGIFVPELSNGGGRHVNVTKSPNVTTFIEQVVNIRSAYFQFDTRHADADLTVVVHNGELLENASIILTNGAREVQWTDENGVAKFSPSTGKYVLVIEAEGFDSMLVEDLFFEAQNSYLIRVNMSDCLSSSGTSICAPDADDLIMYYRQKEPAMNPITPQGFVNYFAERLTKCRGGDDKNADDTLERMATKWGIYPDPPLNVLLYSCEFTEVECTDNECTRDINYVVKNYQQYKCEYTVNLICNDTITEIGNGTIGPAGATTDKKSIDTTVIMPGNCSCMHLMILSDKAGA